VEKWGGRRALAILLSRTFCSIYATDQQALNALFFVLGLSFDGIESTKLVH